ncbi:helix-turn-helix transcriptional regulator [Mesorhizobium xinjiangense]|uniref:helix-turn-helix transcriptional regulator n=1 Tax=Mesorhizobium xinjiangense TaxID=2678685 RepID=UPI0012ED614E|nr:helix-turn-helix transcriptional regulator [Mesorhizobium xinjiangense]
MNGDTTTAGAEYLTTRELADLLRIKERKVYDLAAGGEVPCIRVVGKLLFPRHEIDAWIAASRSGPVVPEPAVPLVLAGSHDPLLEWALRESGSGIAAFFDGSLDGVERFARREAIACGLHVHEDEGGWNSATVRQALGNRPAVLIEFARRQRGLIVAAGNPQNVAALRDLAPLSVAKRQSSAGSQRLFEALAAEAGIDPAALAGPTAPARTEDDVAMLVLDGKADAAFGLEAMAARYRLGFVPLLEERFDILVWRRDYFDPPFQAFLRFVATPAFADRAADLAGYDMSGLGTVHFNGAAA